VKLRLGLLDLSAVGVVIFAVVLPAPSRKIHPLFEGEAATRSDEIAAAQAELARSGEDRAALARLTDLLVYAGQSDWALRVTGAAHEVASPTRWRAALSVATAHAERLDAKDAREWAAKALADCDAPGADCPDHERVRIDLYVKALDAGLASGIDPKVDPEGFKAAIDSATPIIRVGGKKYDKPPP
jgi:hypothetical protein